MYQKEIKEHLSQLKKRYQILVHLWMELPILLGFLGGIWLAWKTGQAMGLSEGVPLKGHPHGPLFIANLVVMSGGGMALFMVLAKYSFPIILYGFSDWSWKETKQAYLKDDLPKQWYK